MCRSLMSYVDPALPNKEALLEFWANSLQRLCRTKPFLKGVHGFAH